MAEPFKSEVITRQTLGRTRNPNTSYIELVDVGFRQLQGFFNAKRHIFNKYASKSKVMFVDNPKLANIDEDTRIQMRDRFKYPLEFNVPNNIEAISFIKEKNIPAVYFASEIQERKE